MFPFDSYVSRGQSKPRLIFSRINGPNVILIFCRHWTVSLYLTLKTTIYHSGIYLELHSITSQHTGITLLPEGEANPPISKEIIGLVPSRIDPVPLISLAWFKVMVLKAQWCHRNFQLFERTSCSWLDPAVIHIMQGPCRQLLIDGNVVLEETPTTCTETMSEMSWNFADYAIQKCSNCSVTFGWQFLNWLGSHQFWLLTTMRHSLN